jgi:hypothetical protein
LHSAVSLWQRITGRLQAALGGAVTAGTTFGLARGSGSLVLPPSSSANYGTDVGTAIQTVLFGGAAAGVGNTLAATVLTPAITALWSQMVGSNTSFVAIDPEKLVPENSPNRPAQIEKVKIAQAKYAVDSLTNILAGMLSFGVANAAKSAGAVNANLPPTANWALGAATSGAAGAINTAITDLFKGSSKVNLVGPNGPLRVNLFAAQSAAPKEVGSSVRNATSGLLGQGGFARQGAQAGMQVAGRAAAVTASTLPLAVLQAAIPALSEAIEKAGASKDAASQAASAVLNLVGFAAVVAIYFNGLGMIGRALPQRPSGTQPPQPQPQQQQRRR